ncbi:hypothetical protein, partial [Rhodococcus sp. (in: high G+C Gram-positive bacteria)]|uniref:hypothetical protein n=1 Tax=Rhodococcus sp. TaxID=1831 RepID=UPI00257C923D
ALRRGAVAARCDSAPFTGTTPLVDTVELTVTAVPIGTSASIAHTFERISVRFFYHAARRLSPFRSNESRTDV